MMPGMQLGGWGKLRGVHGLVGETYYGMSRRYHINLPKWKDQHNRRLQPSISTVLYPYAIWQQELADFH